MMWRSWLRQYGSPRAWWNWARAHPWAATALLIAAFGMRVFLEVVDEYYEQELAPIDQWVQHQVFAHRNPLNTAFAHGISDLQVLPGILALTLPVLIALLAQRRAVAALVFLLVPAVTGMMVELLKLIFHRQRPLDALVAEAGNSFPSGHATGSMVFYGLFGYLILRYWIRHHPTRIIVVVFVTGMIFLTGLARIYLQVHYPSDVAAGWAAGAIILAGAILFLEAWERQA
jgi:membrane-associated phospholipid phosphatase